jgi:glycine cleavage system H lipoate-binding protein
MTVFMFLAFIVSCFIADAIVHYVRFRKAKANETSLMADVPMDERHIYIPKGIYFDKGHTWAQMNDDGRVSIGLDDFLQHVVGRITNVKFVEPGSFVKKGDPIVTIEQDGKDLTLYAPISGTISASNRHIGLNAELINSDPYHDGWIYKIEPANWKEEITSLTPGRDAFSWLKDEMVRLKDFIAFATQKNSNAPAMVMQDGGTIKVRALENSRTETWNDFQNEFINASKE